MVFRIGDICPTKCGHLAVEKQHLINVLGLTADPSVDDATITEAPTVQEDTEMDPICKYYSPSTLLKCKQGCDLICDNLDFVRRRLDSLENYGIPLGDGSYFPYYDYFVYNVTVEGARAFTAAVGAPAWATPLYMRVFDGFYDAAEAKTKEMLGIGEAEQADQDAAFDRCSDLQLAGTCPDMLEPDQEWSDECEDCVPPKVFFDFHMAYYDECGACVSDCEDPHARRVAAYCR